MHLWAVHYFSWIFWQAQPFRFVTMHINGSMRKSSESCLTEIFVLYAIFLFKVFFSSSFYLSDFWRRSQVANKADRTHLGKQPFACHFKMWQNCCVNSFAEFCLDIKKTAASRWFIVLYIYWFEFIRMMKIRTGLSQSDYGHKSQPTAFSVDDSFSML